MTLSSVLAKNTTYLTISSIAQKALAFVWYVYVTQQLNEETLGEYTFAISFTSIFVIVMNFGFIPLLTRDGAKEPTKLQQTFNSIISTKLILTLVSIGLLIAVFQGLNYYNPQSQYTVMLVYLATGIIIFDTFRSTIFAVLRAQQRMQYEAIGQFLYQVAVAVTGTICFAFGYKAGGLILAINVASILFLLYAIVILIKKTDIRWQWQWQWRTVWQLCLVAAPFALADIFFRLNGSIDTVMLKYLAGNRYVAWYNIAQKLTVTLSIIPGMFATAFFPVMSQAIAQSREALRDIFERSTSILFIFSAPLAIGSIVLAPSIINVAFKSYPAAIPALQIFMVSLIFMFANYPIGNALNAANRQLLNTVNMLIALLFNIVLNVLLIPQYTYIGAAVAAVASTIALPLLGLPYIYQMTRFRVGWLLKKLMLTISAALGMGAVVWYLQLILPETKAMFGVMLLAGILSYGILVLLVRAVTLTELRQLWTAIKPSRS
ncbi:MAG: oligosaccharide flippase family protein [Candidatus Kerfeldbacteria bacterium]|nr:oligosaccharide flippase family protein [Candidatus Kerfeldbacteria bacterium]